MNTPSAESIRKPLPAIIGLSAVLAAALIWLIYFKGRVEAPDWVAGLPAVNATFNSLSAMCLVFGYRHILRKNRITHERFMWGATTFSTLFLISYVTYHFFHGDTRFPGQGLIRPIYFFVLITHIGLSMVALPLILTTLWFSLTGRFPFHRRIAKWTFPIWLYVSLSGVIVFLILKAYTG